MTADPRDYPLEPWQPIVGQRVRVLPSPECRSEQLWLCCDTETCCDRPEHEILVRGHDPAERGALGVVDAIEPRSIHPSDPAWDAHRILVALDPPVVGALTDYPQSWIYYAIFELTPAEVRDGFPEEA